MGQVFNLHAALAAQQVQESLMGEDRRYCQFAVGLPFRDDAYAFQAACGLLVVLGFVVALSRLDDFDFGPVPAFHSYAAARVRHVNDAPRLEAHPLRLENFNWPSGRLIAEHREEDSKCVQGKKKRRQSSSHGLPPLFSARASFTMPRNLRASSRICLSFRIRRASAGISSAPTPRAAAPANMKSTAVSWFTPPEAIIGI